MRNEHARALVNRIGTAEQAVAVDTRHKVVAARKGKGAYKRRARSDGRDD